MTLQNLVVIACAGPVVVMRALWEVGVSHSSEYIKFTLDHFNPKCALVPNGTWTQRVRCNNVSEMAITPARLTSYQSSLWALGLDACMKGMSICDMW